MAIYIAISTTNAQYRNQVLAYGENKEAVREVARNIIGDISTEYGTDIYKDTLHKNLRVVSETAAKRKFGLDIDNAECFYNYFSEAKKV